MSYSDITESSYIPSTNTQVFVSDTPFDETEEATSVILTLAGAVSVGQASISVTTGVNKILYEGTRIPFDNGAVYVSTKTPANSTTIPIHPSQININSGSIAKLICYVPLLSFKSINVDHQNQEFTDQAFESAEILKAVSGVITTGSSNGAEIWGDPGLALIKEAHHKRKALRVQILDPGFKGYQEFDSLFSFGNSSGVNSYKQVSISFSGIGVRELPRIPVEFTSNFAFNLGLPPEGKYLRTINAPQEVLDFVAQYGGTVQAYVVSGYVDNGFESVQVPSTIYQLVGTFTHLLPEGGAFMGYGTAIDVLILQLEPSQPGNLCEFNGVMKWVVS